jgi:two-component system cell cycle response regulator DivK
MNKQQALVIDDNKFNSEILTTLLDTAGIDVINMNSPRFLPDFLDNGQNLSVIFLDLEMPNYNGFDVHRALRIDARLNDTPIIAYTVHTSEIDRVRKAGFDGFLGKPIQPEKFIGQLTRILSGKSVWEVG